MRLRKEYIITLVALLLFGGGGYAVWKFYFSAQLDKYREDVKYLDGLKAKLDELQKRFGNQKPEDILTQYAELVQPWSEALDQRGKFYSADAYVKVDTPPEKVVLREYYAEQYQKIVQEVSTLAYNKGVQMPGVDLSFGQNRPDELRGRAVNNMEVMIWIAGLQLGAGFTKELINHNPAYIEAVDMWDPRPNLEILNARTFGVAMWIRMKDLLELYKDLNENKSMYYCVTGMKITNGQLRSAVDPYLRVEMLVDIAAYQPNAVVAIAGAQTQGANAPLGMGQRRPRPGEEPRSSGGFMKFLERLWPI
ncbi:MAG: hypothetical protein K1Y02_03640 [Candidatus Hydrogenedentes bacterium]|nr:hypothetical protein [Candidatus Hydrogenedentota bacterium]